MLSLDGWIDDFSLSPGRSFEPGLTNVMKSVVVNSKVCVKWLTRIVQQDSLDADSEIYTLSTGSIIILSRSNYVCWNFQNLEFIQRLC